MNADRVRRSITCLLMAGVALLLLAGSGPAEDRSRPQLLPPRSLVLVVEVTAVEPFGPAYRAGLEVGDRIFEVDGEAVRSLTDLRRLLSMAGDSARLTVQQKRTGRLASVHVYPEAGRLGIDARMVLAYPHVRYPY